MKKRTTIILSLLGASLLLTACSSPVNLSLPQITPNSQSTSASTGQPQSTGTSTVTNGYAQIFVDPESGNLITIDPKTGEAVPYEVSVTTVQSSNNMTSAQNAGNTAASVVQPSFIGEIKAIEIAMKHASVNSEEAMFALAKLEQEDGRWEYDVEFYAGNKEYDYNIDAVSGTVLNFDYDMESHFTPPVQTQTASQTTNTVKTPSTTLSNTQTPTSTQTADQAQARAQAEAQAEAQARAQAQAEAQARAQAQAEAQARAQAQAEAQARAQAQATTVSIDTARQTALSRVPGATANHIRIYQDYDDGRMVYDGKIIYNSMEYDFEISASTGNIIEWDAESVYD